MYQRNGGTQALLGLTVHHSTSTCRKQILGCHTVSTYSLRKYNELTLIKNQKQALSEEI